jgi:hypothetical protein
MLKRFLGGADKEHRFETTNQQFIDDANRCMSFGHIGGFYMSEYENVSQEEMDEVVKISDDTFSKMRSTSDWKYLQTLENDLSKESWKKCFTLIDNETLTSREVKHLKEMFEGLISYIPVDDDAHDYAIEGTRKIGGKVKIVAVPKVDKEETDVVAADPKIKERYDFKEMEAQLKTLSTEMNTYNLREKVKKDAIQLEPMEVIKQILENVKSRDIFGICFARLIVSKVTRDEITVKLQAVKALQNRVGKINRQLVNLIGYVAGVCVNEIDEYKKPNQLMFNPLLGFSPEDRKLIKRSEESVSDFEKREIKHKKDFVDYQTTMKTMSTYADKAKTLLVWKIDIIKSVKDWCPLA